VVAVLYKKKLLCFKKQIEDISNENLRGKESRSTNEGSFVSGENIRKINESEASHRRETSREASAIHTS
jgi:hypothetical protein